MRIKTAAKRQTIIDAASAAFSELGVEQTSISHIVERIGGSKATIYSYFASKEELVAAVMLQAWSKDIKQLFIHFSEGSDPVSDLANFARDYLVIVLQPEIMTLARSAMMHGDRAGRNFYESAPKRGWDLVADCFEQWKLSNQFPDVDATVAALHLKGLLQAELFDKILFGFSLPEKHEIHATADRAVQAFVRCYPISSQLKK